MALGKSAETYHKEDCPIRAIMATPVTTYEARIRALGLAFNEVEIETKKPYGYYSCSKCVVMDAVRALVAAVPEED